MFTKLKEKSNKKEKQIFQTKPKKFSKETNKNYTLDIFDIFGSKDIDCRNCWFYYNDMKGHFCYYYKVSIEDTIEEAVKCDSYQDHNTTNKTEKES